MILKSLLAGLLSMGLMFAPMVAMAQTSHWEADITIVAGTGPGGPATSYTIERKVGVNAYANLTTSAVAGVNVDPLVPEFTQVCYRWFGVNAAGEGAKSDEICVLAGSVPAKPGGGVNLRFVQP